MVTLTWQHTPHICCHIACPSGNLWLFDQLNLTMILRVGWWFQLHTVSAVPNVFNKTAAPLYCNSTVLQHHCTVASTLVTHQQGDLVLPTDRQTICVSLCNTRAFALLHHKSRVTQSLSDCFTRQYQLGKY